MHIVKDKISRYKRLHAKDLKKKKKTHEQFENNNERFINCKDNAWHMESPKLVNQTSTSKDEPARFSRIGFISNLFRSVTSLHCFLAPESMMSPKINK